MTSSKIYGLIKWKSLETSSDPESQKNYNIGNLMPHLNSSYLGRGVKLEAKCYWSQTHWVLDM